MKIKLTKEVRPTGRRYNVTADGKKLGYIERYETKRVGRKAGRIILSMSKYVDWRPFIIDAKGQTRRLVERGLGRPGRLEFEEVWSTSHGENTRAEAVDLLQRYWAENRGMR